MLVTRVSMISGKPHTLDLPITAEQLLVHASGVAVHVVFRDLSPAQREFLITGITAEEWDETFGEAEGAEG